MRGNINKEMVEKMKRKESLEFELGNSQAAPGFNFKDKKKEKMVVILSSREK
jgi:hypothetical protein